MSSLPLTTEFLTELENRLKIGNRRGVHLNAVPGASRYKFDISRLDDIKDSFANEFIQLLVHESKLNITLDFNPKKKSTNSTNRSNSISNNNANIENIQASENSAYLTLEGFDSTSLNEAKPRLEQIEIERLEEKRIRVQEERMQRSIVILEGLMNQVETIESEKGVNTFAFGFPLFVRKENKDNKPTIAPLFVWNLHIKRGSKHNTWTIYREEDDAFYLNEVLLNSLRADVNCPLDIEAPALDESMVDYIESTVKQIFTQIGIEESDVNAMVIEADVSPKANSITTIPTSEACKEILLNKNRPFVLYAGLFSIFEMPKESIIQDYKALKAQGASFVTEDNRSFSLNQYSAIQTDPSQQGLLRALQSTKNVQIQGPPGTGKSQALTAILFNSMASHKKSIVVCEKRTALEVLYNALHREGVGEHCILLKDITKDRRMVVDSVQKRVNEEYDEVNPTFNSNQLLDQERTLQKLIDDINCAHDQLQTELYDQKNWPELVGKLLYINQQLTDKANTRMLSKEALERPQEEIKSFAEKLDDAEQAYVKFQEIESDSFLNPAIFRDKKDEEIYQLQAELDEKFSEYNEQVHQLKELEETIKTDYFSFHQEKFDTRIEHIENLLEQIRNYLKQYEGTSIFRDYEYVNSLAFKFQALFSKSKKELIKAHRHIVELFAEARKEFDESDSLTALPFLIQTDVSQYKRYMERMESSFKKTQDEFTEIITKRYANFNLTTEREFSNDHLTKARDIALKLAAQIKAEDIICLQSDSCQFKQFTLEVAEVVDQFDKNRTTDHLQREMKWHRFYLSLTNDEKKLIDTLKQDSKWSTLFLREYLHKLITKQSSKAHFNFGTQLNEIKNLYIAIEKYQKEFIKYTWKIKQQQATSHFNATHSFVKVKNIYNKRKSAKNERRPLRKIIEYDFDLFTTYFPVVFTTPEVCSSLFSAGFLQEKGKSFDIVMFDEASQLRIEDNLPALLKAKQVVIAGDEHQMPPSDYFAKMLNVEESAEEDYEDEDKQLAFDKAKDILDCESLLEFGTEMNFSLEHLDFHYRSKHPFLIDFSNHAFYNSRIRPMPNIYNYVPILFDEVKGTNEANINIEEADRVIQIIEEEIHRMPNGKLPSVGVATFNLKQAEYIKNTIYKRCYEPGHIKLKERIDEMNENGFFVKNLENIQGDERDIIIISTTYGPKKDGRFIQNFAQLNRDKGYKLLNVIITRAKYRVYVCTSIPSTYYNQFEEELALKGENNRKAVLYAYLAYARAVSQENEEERLRILSILSKNGDDTNKKELQKYRDSNCAFVKYVHEQLQKNCGDDKVEKDAKLAGFDIDILYTPANPDYPVIVIECDGANEHLSPEVWLHDKHRESILKNFNYVFIRIWSIEWWNNPSLKLKSLLEDIHHAKKIGSYIKQKEAIENSLRCTPKEPENL